MSIDEIVCRQFSELATDYLEGALPGETLELVEEHLAMCDWCRGYAHQIEATARALGAEPEAIGAGPPADTLDALLGAFRNRARGEETP